MTVWRGAPGRLTTDLVLKYRYLLLGVYSTLVSLFIRFDLAILAPEN